MARHIPNNAPHNDPTEGISDEQPTLAAEPPATLDLPPLPEPPDYPALEREQFIANCERAQTEGPTPEVLAKLKAFAQRHGLPFELVRHKFCTDDIFSYTFGIPPKKQTFHELAARQFLAALPLFEGFSKPPAGGKNSLMLTPMGTVMTKEELGSGASSSRSVDFAWHFEHESSTDKRPRILRAYASHKYTVGSGGSQDSARKELLQFLANAAYQAKPGDRLFVAIADGDHYDRRWPELNTAANHGQKAAMAATLAALPKLWAQAVLSWHQRNELPVSPATAQAAQGLEELSEAACAEHPIWR